MIEAAEPGMMAGTRRFVGAGKTELAAGARKSRMASSS